MSDDVSSLLNSVRIVLVHTSHPGNIGAIARAMKTMQLQRLYLVSPKTFPCAEATERASGADDLLSKAVVCETLEEALTGCQFVVGSSARFERRLAWPMLDPRECATAMVAEAEEHEVALVFGRENSGLTNDELACCHYLSHIPANPAYSSLNIGAAVQVFCYELVMAARAGLDEALGGAVAPNQELATADEMESFFVRLEQTLAALNFLDANHPGRLMRRLRRLFNRTRPDQTELNILHGVLSAAQGKKLPKSG